MGKESKIVKVIKSYEDLRNSKPGDFILINGRIELIIAGEPDLNTQEDYQFTTKSVSIEGKYIAQNVYNDNYNRKSKSPLEPFMKKLYNLDLDDPSKNNLLGIAKLGGLL